MTDTNDHGTAIVPSSSQGGRSAARVEVGGKARAARDLTLEQRPSPLPAREENWAATARYAQALLEVRRRRHRRFLVWFFLVVLLPTIAAAVYSLKVASPRYVSEFEFTYQTYRGPSSLAAGLVESVTGTNQQNTVDLGKIVYEYARSPALAEKLEASVGLRQHFSDAKIDWMSRLGPQASREQLLDYFRSHVSVSQGLGGYLNIKVDAFDPVFAHNLAAAIVQACDQMVDELSARARRKAVEFAEAELGRQEQRVKAARMAMTQFQNQHGDQDPTRAAAQLGSIVGGLETDLANARAQLADATSSAGPTSPIATQLKTRITALETQIQAQKTRLATTSGGGETPYSEILDQYSALQIEQDFAKSAYLSAQQGLVLSRADAARQQDYLVDFAPPTAPEGRSYANAVQTTATVFLVALLVFGLGSLVVSAAKDQLG